MISSEKTKSFIYSAFRNIQSSTRRTLKKKVIFISLPNDHLRKHAKEGKTYQIEKLIKR